MPLEISKKQGQKGIPLVYLVPQAHLVCSFFLERKWESAEAHVAKARHVSEMRFETFCQGFVNKISAKSASRSMGVGLVGNLRVYLIPWEDD